jgi:hypothetical protein
MKKTVTYKGNIFIYTVYDCRKEGNGEKGYVADVDLFNGCMTSIQSNNMRELEKQVRSAIKDWLEPTSLNVAERQRLEQLERLVAVKDYFYKAMADSVSDEYVEKCVQQFLESKKIEHGISFVCSTDTMVREAIKAGIQYALKATTEGK